MRTTLTLDPDVAARLTEAAREQGVSLKAIVNATLRDGLALAARPEARRPFVLEPLDTGEVMPGVDLERLDDTLDLIDGPMRR